MAPSANRLIRGLFLLLMPKRRLTDPPADLQWCIKCRKVLGEHGGWFGAQCMCGVDLSKASGRAHSAGKGSI